MTYRMPMAVSVQRAVPVSLGTVNVSVDESPVRMLFLNNASLIAVLTINLPDGQFDGQLLRATFNAAITLINWTGAGALGVLTAGLAGGYCAFVWDAGASTWRRCA